MIGSWPLRELQLGFTTEYPGSHAIFQTYRISDHSPAVLKIRKLLHAQGNIHDRVTKLRTELDEVQTALDRNHTSTMLREEDGVYLTAFTQALLDKERFLKQKSKIDWLKVGNSNSAFFHRSVKERVSRTRIDCIHGQDNVVYEGSAVPHLFVNHYTNFLGTKSSTTTLNQVGLFGRKLNASKAEAMIREVTNEEIKRDIAVHDFFVNGKLLQEVNHTILTLLPKVKSSILNLMPFEEGILPIKAINTGGFNMQEKVVDIVHENAWEDGIYLKLQDGSLKNYYVREIWNDIRGHGTDVAWHSFVWSNYGIPRHAIHVWLTDIMAWDCPLAETNMFTCIVGRLIVAAMSYYVWQEQLTRVHGNETQKHGGFNKHYCRCDQIETSINQFQEKDASGQYEEDMKTVMARVMEAY
ncbi:hypothetical protein Tco_0663121 [Tanacetum coccineum]